MFWQDLCGGWGTSGGEFAFGFHVFMGDVFAEGDCEGGGLGVADLLVAAIADFFEVVAGGLVQGGHVAALA